MNWASILSGSALGIALGWALQRGGFCMNTAIRSILFEKDRSLLQSWILILLINIPLVTLMTDVGVLSPLAVPFRPVPLVIGGLLFGGGMVMGGGCVSGTCYRSGRGMLSSWATLTGFLLGSTAVFSGLLSPVNESLGLGTSGSLAVPQTLFELLGAEILVSRWLIVLAICVPLALLLFRFPKQKFVFGWSWKKTGVIVGSISALVWLVSGLLGRNYGLSFTQPASALLQLVVTGDGRGIGFPAYTLLGVFMGSFLSAWRFNEAKLTLPSPVAMVRQLGGGLVMGIGAAFAGGCNIGHGISGLSVLSTGSVLAIAAIMAGNWMATAGIIVYESGKTRVVQATDRA